jgi:outer membrane putative beta-barrel porin/alpha-amylase
LKRVTKVTRTRRKWPRAFLLVLAFSSPCRAETQVDFRFIPAYFSGDFGSDINSQIAYIPLIVSVQSRRNELKVTLPYLLVRSDQSISIVGGEVIPLGGPPQTESGPGDAILEEAYYLKEGTRRSPWVYAGVKVKFPTGDESKGLGTGTTDIGPGVGVLQPLGSRWTLLVEYRYVFRGNSSDTNYRNTPWVSVGTQGRISEASWLGFFYDRIDSVIAGRDAIADVSAGYDVKVSPAVKIRSALFKGVSETAEDYGLSLGFSVIIAGRHTPSPPVTTP